MRLHYNVDALSVARVRKLKSVVRATEAKVEDAIYKEGGDVRKVSYFNVLPLLETPEGTFFSSNTILRLLATLHKPELYGGEVNHARSLVDMWLDNITNELEPAVTAILLHQQGKQIDFGKLMEDVNKYMGIVEKHLAGNKFLVGESYSIADLSLAASVSVIFSVMLGEGPRKKYSNTMKWYLMMTEINPEVGPKDLPKEADDAFKGGKKGKKEEEKPKKEKKKEEKKEEKKEQKKEQKKAADDDDDLFGDDDTPAAPKEVPKPVVKKKEGKKKAIPKSIVVFDVKVYDQETDLNQLFEKVKTISLDGLVWNNEPKILPVAFGMNKLQCGCVIEDEKINTDDIFEKIEDWEEVQSTDVVSFQKL